MNRMKIVDSPSEAFAVTTLRNVGRQSCQAGFQASGVEWSDISRGMHRDAQAADELQMRGFWRQLHGHMMGLARVEVQDLKPARQAAAAAAGDDD